jgi:hypothetical protein
VGGGVGGRLEKLYKLKGIDLGEVEETKASYLEIDGN